MIGNRIVSRIGLGLAALGRPGYVNLGHSTDLGPGTDVPSMEARTHEVLDFARSAGVLYYDAARSYGRAEEFLASWLKSRRIDPESLTVGSKWGYVYTAGWRATAAVHEVKDLSRANLDRQWVESTELLGSYLNLYQIHSATTESGVLENAAVLDRLEALRDAGVLVGLSVSGPNQADAIRRAIAIERAGRPLFASVQATWNLLERSAGTALGEARDRGLSVIVKEGLANGRLTDRNHDDAIHPLLKSTADRLNTTTDALALAAVVAQPWATVALSGAATIGQLRSNLKALDAAWDDQADHELAGLVEAPSSYWKTRAGLPWT